MGRGKRPSARRWRSTGWVPDERAARRRRLEQDAQPDVDDDRIDDEQDDEGEMRSA